MSAVRRLAAILAADVAGYSRLMGADEEGTHERVKGHCRHLFDPKIKEHHGRKAGSPPMLRTARRRDRRQSPVSSVTFQIFSRGDAG